MLQPFFFWKVLFILSLFLICIPQVSMATGMQPDSSLLLIQEKESGGSMNVTNTDNIPSLLYTQVINVDGEDDTIKLLPTQPVVRVEGGKTQQVRFILKTEKPPSRESRSQSDDFFSFFYSIYRQISIIALH